MRANLERALDETWGHEGGYTADPRDPGNWTGGKRGVGTLKGTKYGISAGAYPHIDIKRLTRARAAEIYRKDYWGAVKGDALPSGPDVQTFDGAVNSGPYRSTTWLQKALGAVSVDGKVGPLTIRRAMSHPDLAGVIKKVSSIRLGFMRGLSSMWKTYGTGWTRRVYRVEVFAMELLLTAGGASQGEVKGRMAKEATEAHDAKQQAERNGGATGGATGAGGVGANETGLLTAEPWVVALVAMVLIAGIVGVSYFIYKRQQQKTREEVYKEAAA